MEQEFAFCVQIKHYKSAIVNAHEEEPADGAWSADQTMAS
jgi:hypothetical protein